MRLNLELLWSLRSIDSQIKLKFFNVFYHLGKTYIELEEYEKALNFSTQARQMKAN
jgi:hypothetical protein